MDSLIQIMEKKSLALQKDSIRLFTFGLNTLPDSGWRKLGITEKQIATIRNYLNKGGYFYKPADLQKIYGFKEKLYLTLYPFIRINKRTDNKTNKTIATINHHISVAINTANEDDFESLPGIGAILAKRIIKFRKALAVFIVASKSHTFTK